MVKPSIAKSFSSCKASRIISVRVSGDFVGGGGGGVAPTTHKNPYLELKGEVVKSALEGSNSCLFKIRLPADVIELWT
jgi:hypothetical protein